MSSISNTAPTILMPDRNSHEMASMEHTGQPLELAIT